MQYDPQKNISALNVTTITQSSAEQRKGRAGRTEAGKCFRLFSEDTFSKMELTTKPEILRVHLGQALLKLFELGVNPLLFDFVERPSQDLMDAAVETLELVGAISENQITKLGKWVARLPIDPKFGAFVYTAVKEGIGIEAIIVSACCGASNVFYRSGTEKQKNLADERKIRFCHEGGDFMTMLNVFREWHGQPEKGKASWCCENFINGKVMRGIRETVNEVLNVLKKELSIQLKFVLKPPVNVDDRLQKMLFKMFRKNICHYLGHEKAGYLVVHTDQNVQIFPGSSLKCLGLQPDWMVIERVLKTSRDYASNVTPLKQSWIDEGLSDCLFSLNIESIHSQRVEQAMSYKIGVQLYADFVGLRYINLRNLEKEIKQNCGAEFVIIEASKEYGEISVYTTPSHVKMVSELVGKRISTLKQKQISEKKEYFLSLSHSGVKVAIGAGLTIVDVLMPNEYTTVLVTVKDNSPSEKEIREYFEQWGTIYFVNQFKNSLDKTKWGKVTYFNKEDAKLSVASTKDNSKMKAIPDTNSQPQMRTTSSFVGITTAKLEWMRPRSMFAFIRFSSTSIVEKACETSIYIKGVCLKIKKDKNNNSGVFVTNIAAGTTEKDLRGTIKTVLSLSPRDITNVSLKKPSTPSPEEKLASLRQLITTEIDKYVKDGDYKLDLIPPREHHSTYNAYLTCTKEEELIATYVGLNHILKIESELVTITIEFTTSLKIPIRIQTKYQSVIDEYSQDFGKKFSIRCRKKEKNGIIWISLQKEVKAETVPQLNAFKEMVLYVKSVISKAIEGKRCGTEDIDDIQNLFTSHGKRFIDKVKNETNALLFIDYRDFTITIHGSELEKAQAFMMLTTYISDLKTGTSKQIPLKGSDKPPGVMKEITLRYESDLNKLQVESGVRYIELDRKRHIVTVTGEMRAIETCIAKIQSVIEDLMQRQKDNTLQVTKTRVCVVCFCPIEEGDIYRLEICGHSYCKECVQSQFKSSLNSGDLPLTCSSEDCNEKWVLKDIMRIAEKSSVEYSELVQKATSVFVVRNQKSYKYCPTPDCPVIYRLTEKENVFTCSQCDLRICTGCQKEYHDGMTCATAKELEENRRDPDKKFKEWLENNKNVKQCPVCSTPIEKIHGCNHMTCVACKVHICWVCLQHFPESRQCYDHLTKYHGGCFDYQFT